MDTGRFVPLTRAERRRIVWNLLLTQTLMAMTFGLLAGTMLLLLFKMRMPLLGAVLFAVLALACIAAWIAINVQAIRPIGLVRDLLAGHKYVFQSILQRNIKTGYVRSGYGPEVAVERKFWVDGTCYYKPVMQSDFDWFSTEYFPGRAVIVEHLPHSRRALRILPTQ